MGDEWRAAAGVEQCQEVLTVAQGSGRAVAQAPMPLREWASEPAVMGFPRIAATR